jgi:hypothetical protein
MEKIPTILKRDEKTKKLIAVFSDQFDRHMLDSGFVTATEKIDGTNIRLTVRNHLLVRIEARRNPTRDMKAKGIVHPWYRDVWVATADSPTAAAGTEAAASTNLEMLGDGEWSAEAVGPKIQGNPLELEEHTSIVFSDETVREGLAQPFPLELLSRSLTEIHEALKGLRSRLNPEAGVEGIVLWFDDPECFPRPFGKLKVKDFA